MSSLDNASIGERRSQVSENVSVLDRHEPAPPRGELQETVGVPSWRRSR